MVEKAMRGLDVDHSYTPSLTCPFISALPLEDPSQQTYKERTQVRHCLRQFEMEMRFFFIVGTRSTSSSLKFRLLEFKEVEPECVIGRPEPSPVIMPSLPWYDA